MSQWATVKADRDKGTPDQNSRVRSASYPLYSGASCPRSGQSTWPAEYTHCVPRGVVAKYRTRANLRVLRPSNTSRIQSHPEAFVLAT